MRTSAVQMSRDSSTFVAEVNLLFQAKSLSGRLTARSSLSFVGGDFQIRRSGEGFWASVPMKASTNVAVPRGRPVCCRLGAGRRRSGRV